MRLDRRIRALLYSDGRELSAWRAILDGMPWMNAPRLVLDTETTGTDPTEARLVTACQITVRSPEDYDERNWIADPGVEIPTGASDVHGVTTERARAEGRPEVDVLSEIAETLEREWNAETPLVIYNAPYDLTLLDRRFRAHGIGECKIRGPVLDALALDRSITPRRRGNRKLITMCGHYGVSLSEDDAHNATADSWAAHDLTWAMAERHGLDDTTLRALYVAQRRGHRAWAQGFQAWLRSAPRRSEETDEQAADRAVVVINDEWPMQTLAETETAA